MIRCCRCSQRNALNTSTSVPQRRRTWRLGETHSNIVQVDLVKCYDCICVRKMQCTPSFGKRRKRNEYCNQTTCRTIPLLPLRRKGDEIVHCLVSLGLGSSAPLYTLCANHCIYDIRDSVLGQNPGLS